MKEPLEGQNTRPTRARVTWEQPSHSPEQNSDPTLALFSSSSSRLTSEALLNAVILGTMALLLIMIMAVITAG